MNTQIKSDKFENYFSAIYQERWTSLRDCLQKPVRQVLRYNQFAHESISAVRTDPQVEGLLNCYWRQETESIQQIGSGLFEAYILDPASVIVARSLEVQPTDQVLDLCAAPGGKSLILAEEMYFKAKDHLVGQLVSNEISEARRGRLLQVFKDYIPRELRDFIHVRGLDGNQYGLRFENQFDRVLADVPCSGERHLFENLSEMTLWTEKRTKNLSVRQYSLLCSAWLACKVGGRIVYSTCSISPVENDQVVQKLIKKRKPTCVRLEHLTQFDFIEKTEYGYQILPDRCGFGPMYFSILEKN